MDRGVSFRHLPTATYDRGKSRTNRLEAEAIVADAVSRMKKCLELPEDERLTFGVITFNTQQQSLIQDLFDDALKSQPELEWYFANERIEPSIVRNLENVQGDERDVMFFSISFGRDAAGKFPVSFGAINRDGGERRLNVAVTRARQELIVYSSFTADQLDANRSKARGVHHLKAFLEYAEKGPIAIAAQTAGSMGGYDSPLEEAVADALAAKGWQVVSQVGVSGFRVDLGIVHPDKPGAYLAGVECDGAAYHRSAVARDRDKTRQQVLENLGWNIIRIWSPDWWYDAESATQRTDQALNSLLAESRSRNNSQANQRSEDAVGVPVVDGNHQVAPTTLANPILE
jgi:very-short-patch-repair endonuclease